MRIARPVVFTLVAASATLVADAARADVASGPCDPKTLECSAGTTSLHAESRDPMISSITTGWLPACQTPDAQGHCNDENIQFQASIDLGAVPAPSTDPFWVVDMPRSAVVDAAWPSDKSFDLTIPVAATKDGTFKVTHSLLPEVRVYASLFGLSKTWTFDTTSYLQKVAPNFRYKATNTVDFFPWGMQPVTNLVPSPALGTTALFSTKIVSDANNDVDVNLSAKTSPTFTYKTTKVTFAGAQAPIATLGGSAKLPMIDADFLDIKVDVEGSLTVEGELALAPNIVINKIGGITVPSILGTLDLTDPLNMPKQAYSSATPTAVKFPSVTVHIPLPNVKAPTSTVDLGAVQLGQRADKSVTIKNTGELGAKMTFESSDPQFTVTGAALVDPKADYTLAVRFTPAKEGAASATITVKSNDPDQRVQTFQVTANGTPVPVPPAEPPAAEEPAPQTGSDSGCGCHTTGGSTSTYGAFAGLGLAAALVARRRRR